MNEVFPPHPDAEALSCLSPVERRWYSVADRFNRRLKWFGALYIRTIGCAIVWFCACNRLRIEGTDRLERYDESARALIVANHRSFWDFYVFAYVALKKSRMGARLFFPVRSKFFYTRAIGGWINALISMMAMFPPILPAKKGRAWNRYAIDRLRQELHQPGTWVGIHPEGTRNRDPDPYTFLKAQIGAGQIAITLDGVRVVPAFIMGMTNNLAQEIWWNWTNPEDHIITVCIGEEVELDDLRAENPRLSVYKRAADRCMDAVRGVAEEHRDRMRQARVSVVPVEV